jgi:hypothetical protein
MGRSLDLWGKQQVVLLFRLSVPGHHNNLWSREIAEPQKLLPHLLQPNVSLLASETIAAYIQAAVKLFGSWSMELSQDWDNGRIQDVREIVDTLISRLENFTSHSEVEVQERVCPIGAILLSILLNRLFLGCKRSTTARFHPCRPCIVSSGR